MYVVAAVFLSSQIRDRYFFLSWFLSSLVCMCVHCCIQRNAIPPKLNYLCLLYIFDILRMFEYVDLHRFLVY